MSLRMKCLTILVALGFFAGSARADNPKTYRFTLSTASQIGAADLRPGEYKLVVDTHDPTVLFTEERTGKEIPLEAKVETVAEKYEHTSIHSNRVGDVNRIVQIRLGGTKTAVNFE
jgi:hypothetical protein